MSWMLATKENFAFTLVFSKLLVARDHYYLLGLIVLNDMKYIPILQRIYHKAYITCNLINYIIKRIHNIGRLKGDQIILLPSSIILYYYYIIILYSSARVDYTCWSWGLASAAYPEEWAISSLVGGTHFDDFHGATPWAYNSSTSSKVNPLVSTTKK